MSRGYNRYIHAGYNPHTWNGRNAFPADFRKPEGLANVAGGRWGVRKIALRTRDGKQWSAYCGGTLKGMSARFRTQGEAMHHAVEMAQTKARLTS